jgi:hypothetical protein
MLVQEITTIKPTPPKTPAQARVAAMTQNVDRARDALAAEKKRQKVLKAQQNLHTAMAHAPT